MFPLSILPLPGELVPLHIFEIRYRQLLQEAESDDISFGIFFNSTINTEKIGSLMKLESVIKRYPEGESDVIVKCHGIFTMDKLYRTFKSKMYPGGDVTFWEIDESEVSEIKLAELFQEYLIKRNIKRQQGSYGIYSIAQELNLELNERYTFLLSDPVSRITFLMQRIKYQIEILNREEKSRDVYHLN
jgi:Lon protease-like protein